jgi:integrase
MWADIEAGGIRKGISVGDLVQQHIDHKARPAGTLMQYKSYQKTIAQDFPMPAAQLTSRHVAAFREANHKRKVYANGCIALICAASKLGNELGVCQVITVRKWEAQRRGRILLPAEFVRIRTKALDWLKVMMDLAYLTAARPSDLMLLQWAKVTDTVVAIRQKKTSTRQEFINDEALAGVLAEARSRPILGLYVVADHKGRPVSRDKLQRAWVAACEAASVADAQFRDIRAMAAMAAKEGGLDYQALLGHSTQAMSDTYLKGVNVVTAKPIQQKL